MSKPFSWRDRIGIRLALATAVAGVASLCVALSASAFVLNVLPTTLPDTTKGQPYSQTLTLSAGFVGPVVWEASGSLPPGITLSLSGVLSGTCSSPGAYTFTANAVDNGWPTPWHVSRTYTVTVNPPVNIDATMPAGEEGAAYDQTIGYTGGTAPYVVGIVGPEGGGYTLPTGLNSDHGRIYGTPAVGMAGTHYIMLGVTDAAGYNAIQTLTLNISAPVTLAIGPATVGNATIGLPYTTTFTATPGTAPYSWSITGGAVPTGLSLNLASGVLSGTATVGGPYSFTVKVNDSATPSHSQSKTYTMKALVAPTLGPSSTAAGTVGTAYTVTLTAGSAIAPYVWSSSGTLPPGLTLGSSGVLTGTPTAAGTYTFTGTATDSEGAIGSKSYTIVINAAPYVPGPLTITTSIVNSGTVGSYYSQSFYASGGTLPYYWSVQSGTLPAGLTLSSSGVLNGTPAAANTYTFALHVSDAPGASAYQTYSVYIGSSVGTNPLLTNLANRGLAVHNLVKLPDDGNAYTQEDSAVYYLGVDGKRHAFPNSKVYFTWFAGFDGVRVINSTDMASIPLGNNVTYKPGNRMVKFTTDPKVYAVDRYGTLRWVKTESLAISLYGSGWNHMVDDISDAFYTNYVFGADINNTGDYSTSAAASSVTYVSDSLRL